MAVADAYVGRDPDDPNVVACCEAIERHYFPPGLTGTREPDAARGT